MGAPLVTSDIIVSLRNYARAATLEVSIKLGGVALFAVTLGALSCIGILLTAAARSLGRLPRAVLYGLGGVSLIALLHPESRAFLREKQAAFQKNWRRVWARLAPHLLELGNQLTVSQLQRSESWSLVSGALQPARKHPAKSYVLAACLEAGQPRTLAEIEQRVRAYGYATRARNFRGYLSTLLRQGNEFVEGPVGRWGTKTAPLT